METRTITLAEPELIDGEVVDVERQVVADLETGTDLFVGWLDQAIRQLANAERQRHLSEDGMISASDLRDAFENSTRAAQLARLRGASEALIKVSREITR
jgi:hypothetical protein